MKHFHNKYALFRLPQHFYYFFKLTSFDRNGSSSGFLLHDIKSQVKMSLFVKYHKYYKIRIIIKLYSWQLSNLMHKFLSMYLFIYSSLHVSSMSSSSSGETDCINTASGNCHSLTSYNTKFFQ